MAELHPFFVHFPIALLVTAVLFDLWGVIREVDTARQTALTLQIMAAVSALLAALSGHGALQIVQQQEHLAAGVAHALDVHTSLGNVAVWVIMIVVFGRGWALLEQKSWARTGWVFPVLGLGLAVLVLFTGCWGGFLSQAILQFFK